MKPKLFLSVFILICSTSHCIAQTNKLNAYERDCFKSLKRFITPQGKIIDYKFSVDSIHYFVKWGTKNKLRTLKDTFSCDNLPVANPWFVAENKNYIVMQFGCGSPCWEGIFLSMHDSIQPQIIEGYVTYDLNNDLVVSPDFNESHQPLLVIHNLRTNKDQKIIIKEGCFSAIPVDCLDSIAIKNRMLYYKWNKDDTGKTIAKKVKIII